MAEIKISLSHGSYPVSIEDGNLDRIGAVVASVAPHRACALLGDTAVLEKYGERAKKSLQAAGYNVVLQGQDAGEEYKTLETVSTYYQTLLQHRLERKSPVISLGGGVAGDTVGFAAATYLRGVPFIQCPTTLLAMVDASVGGKVGVNVPQGKNLIGSFHQPRAVIIDPSTLITLPERDLRGGLAECVKHGMIRDATLFAWLETEYPRLLQREPAALQELVERNVAIKAAVVMEDEKEEHVRAHLNFGHTFAHAIEKTAGYGTVQHGEAVSLGMVAATNFAVAEKRCSIEVLERLMRLLTALGLPTRFALASHDALLAAMALDKKVEGGAIRLILPEKVGSVTIVDGTDHARIRAAWNTISL